MDFATAITTCLKKYATFEGRAPRSEYWYFSLFAFGACLTAMLLDAVVDPQVGGLGVLYALTALGLLLPSISVVVRRLHDTDRSGWWYWLALLPLVGVIILLVWFCQAGTEGENQYGGNPLDHAGEDDTFYQRALSTDLDRLERLAELHAKGALTKEEFESQKAIMFGAR